MNQTNDVQNISENMENTAAVLAASSGTYGNVYLGNALIGENPKLNVADKGFIFVQPGLNCGAGSRQLSVNLIYNSKLGNVQSLCGGMPTGWKLDAHQFLKLDGTDSSNVSTYKYIDAYGYVHTFVRYNSSPEEYSDAEGMGYTLKKNGSQWEISEISGDRMVFDGSGRLVKTISGFNSSIVKMFTYSGSQLTKIYDTRDLGTYISFSYSSGLLQNIYVYYDSVLKATLNLVSGGSTFTEVKYKVNANSTDFKSLATFEYTSGKLTSIIDETTKAATRVTYTSGNVSKVEQGYKESSFVARTSLTVSSSESYSATSFCRKCVLKSEKNVYSIYYLDNRGNIISTFEGENANDLHTTSKEMGISLGFEGTSSETINGHKAKSLNGASQTAVLETTIYSSSFSAASLENSQNLALCFWIKLKSSPVRANLTVKATLAGGSVYTKSVVLNADAQDAWQQVSVPISRGTKAITKITVSITNDWEDNVNADICNFYMRKGEERNLYFNNDYSLDDLKTMTVNGFKYFLKLDNVYLTESDVLNTFRAKAKGNNHLICNNGRKRFASLSSITFQTENSANFTVGSMNGCRVEVTDAGNRKNTTKYYTFTSANTTVEEEIVATMGNATLDSATNAQKRRALIVQRYDSYGNKVHESDIYGKVTDYEYNEACEVKKITETADGESRVTYSSEEDGEEYKTAEMQGFDAQGFSYYKPFGTIDTVTEKSYNVKWFFRARRKCNDLSRRQYVYRDGRQRKV